MPRSKAQFTFGVPVTASLPPFALSTALAHIDPSRVARLAKVAIEVGTFGGTGGCGQTVTAEVRKGVVRALRTTPCTSMRKMPSDPSIAKLAAAARRQLGLRAKPPVFKPMPFAAFQQHANEITVTTITCTQYCIWGWCFVCCTQPSGDVICGRELILHT